MSITSFPPDIRMNVAYLLLGGICLGPTKPNMELILGPILTKINTMKVSIEVPEGPKIVKAKLLLGVFDLPAKAMGVSLGKYNLR